MSITVNANEILLDIAPGPDAIRNSEGDVVELRDGRLLFVYSRFREGEGWDDDPAGLGALILSPDGSRVVEPPYWLLAPEADEARNIMSVSVERMSNGDIGLFYFLRRGFHDGRLHLRRSADEGRSWSAPVPCVPAPGYSVSNNDRTVRLRSGRLIVPVAAHRSIELGADEQGRMRYSFDYVSQAIFYRSDDDGASWQPSNSVALISRHSRTGLQEPGLIEREDGSLYAWARTDMGRQYEMQSFDQGESWTPAEPSPFTGPCSPLSMKRDPADGSLIAVWNPAPAYPTRPLEGSDRTPLVIARSRDDGRSWSEPLVLEDDPRSGYCYTTIYFPRAAAPGTLLLAYCAGSAEEGILNRLRIRRLELG